MPHKPAIVFVALLGMSSIAVAAELPGTWGAQVDGIAYDLVFDAEGGLSLIEENEAIVVAEYEAGGGELTITDLGGAKACEGDQVEGTYTYSLDGGALSLTRAEDNCSQRAEILDGTTFQAEG